jgi:predicted MPP superfamily phosphohydrolase
LRLKSKKNKYRAAFILLIFLALLYFLLKGALPQYSGRIPLLGMFLIVEYLVFNFIRDVKPAFNEKFKNILIFLWWLPVILLILFLVIAAFIPIIEWKKVWLVYLPGVGIMALLAKSVLFILLIPALLMDVFRRIFHRRIRSSGYYLYIVRFLKRMAILIGSLAFVSLVIGSIHWVSKFKTREVNIKIENLPETMNGLRIVQLSDIHLGSWVTTKPLERAVEIVNELKPDLVLFTGDMVNFSAKETNGFETVLSKIRAPYGVYAIMGNHDYGDYISWPDSIAKAEDLKKLEAFYRTLGWRLLRNEHTLINIKGGTILLAGVENWSATARFHRYGNMNITMQNAPDSDVSILMSHDPTHWDAEVTKKYKRFDLTLSGHTHGMQMGFEGFGIKWSPSQYVYKNWGGLYKVTPTGGITMNLYVNLGLGHIAYPGRVGMLPEITLLTLTD